MAVRGGCGAEVEVGISRLRSVVATLHRDLHTEVDDVAVSARVPGTGLLILGSSDQAPVELAPEHLVLFTVDGQTVRDTPGSDHEPVPDARAHAAIYRAMPDVGGVARLTAPVVPHPADLLVGATVGSSREELGHAIVAALRGHDASTVVMPGHGVYAAEVDVQSAVEAVSRLGRSDAPR